MYAFVLQKPSLLFWNHRFDSTIVVLKSNLPTSRQWTFWEQSFSYPEHLPRRPTPLCISHQHGLWEKWQQCIWPIFTSSFHWFPALWGIVYFLSKGDTWVAETDELPSVAIMIHSLYITICLLYVSPVIRDPDLNDSTPLFKSNRNLFCNVKMWCFISIYRFAILRFVLWGVWYVQVKFQNISFPGLISAVV